MKDWQVYLIVCGIISMAIFGITGSGSMTGSFLFPIMIIGGIGLGIYRYVKRSKKEKAAI